MAVLQATDIPDLVATTLNNLGRLKATDLMSTYQNTIFYKRMMKKGKARPQEGGTESEFNLITGTNDSARGVGLYYVANVDPSDVMATGKMPWRHQTWNWGIERREIAMNAPSANKIVDLIKTRRMAAFGGAVLYFEQKGWRCPASTNTTDFMGIPYWIVKSGTATTTNDGFNGSVPSGYTTVANIDPTAVGITPKWNNYAAPYTDVSAADLVPEMERMSDMTYFMPLVDDGMPSYDTGEDYGYYMGRTVRQGLKEILKAQNQDLGFDLDPVGDKLAFRRAPMVWVKELDLDTTGVIYAIYWGTFGWQYLKGENLKETHIAYHSNQPTVSATHTDNTGNTFCTDRRRNGVLSTGTTMPA